MNLDLLGHACVALQSAAGETLLVDPYASGQFDGRLAYDPIDVAPDFVVCSHGHADHAAISAVPGEFELVDEGRAGDFSVRRIPAWHDEYDGRRRGGSVDILDIEADGARVLHLSDVGQSPIGSIVESIRHPDVLLVPVGGFFTIGAAQAWEWIERIQPRCAIPIHQRTPACSLPIRDAEAFAAWRSESARWKLSPISVQDELPSTLFLAHRLTNQQSGSRASPA